MTNNSPEYFERLANHVERGEYDPECAICATEVPLALRAAAALAREVKELREKLEEWRSASETLRGCWTIDLKRAESAESANRALQAEVDRLRRAVTRPVDAAQTGASETVDSAYAFVESMIPRADAHHGSAPLWYGWALREAYLAGAQSAAIEGYVMVPFDPTPGMIEAGKISDPLGCDVPEEDEAMIYTRIYQGMISADQGISHKAKD